MKMTIKISILMLGMAILPVSAAAQEEIGIAVEPVSGYAVELEGLSSAAEKISAALGSGDNASASAALGRVFSASAVKAAAPAVRLAAVPAPVSASAPAPVVMKARFLVKSSDVPEVGAAEKAEEAADDDEGGFLDDAEVAKIKAGMAAAYAEESGAKDSSPTMADLGKMLGAGVLGVLVVTTIIVFFPVVAVAMF